MNGVIDWNSFQTDIYDEIDSQIPLKTADELDNGTHYFTNLLQRKISTNIRLIF